MSISIYIYIYSWESVHDISVALQCTTKPPKAQSTSPKHLTHYDTCCFLIGHTCAFCLMCVLTYYYYYYCLYL